jgi:hypothetical protein
VPRDARGRLVKGHGDPRGSWKKGHTPSPGGLWGTLDMQRKLEGRGGTRVLQKMFRRKSIVVMHALQRVILDPEAPAAVRVAAAQLMLERAWGKPDAEPVQPKRLKRVENDALAAIARIPRSPYKSGGL